MISYNKLRKDLLVHNITIMDLEKYKLLFQTQYNLFLGQNNGVTTDELKNYLYLCLDYYTYNADGDSLIPDAWYDTLMNLYVSRGNEPFYHADYIGERTMWPFVKHEAPYMVGSLAKIYDPEDLYQYLYDIYNRDLDHIILAPKFDGVSCCIKVLHGVIEYGVTRGNGIEGQDITEVVLRAKCNLSEGDGFYKCELCVGKSDFNRLTEMGKKYANRRSATTGLINTPKNVEFASCITVIPLLYTSINGSIVKYIAHDSKKIYTKDIDEMSKKIARLREKLREPDYEFRTDGVVLFPIINGVRIDRSDIMSTSIAFKVNSIMNDTLIRDVYISIGRLGKAVPMASLVPVEVNETTVTDVSLGSFGNYENYAFHYGEVVEAYSAGNVIPQIRPKEDRKYPKKSEIIKLKYRCPYCDEKLTKKGQEYFCTNSRCDHLVAGRITNFITKLGVENISDKTIELLVEERIIKKLPDIFYLKYDDIINLPGFSDISSSNFIREIQVIKEKPIPASVLIGALGIEKISTKKCEKIFASVDLKNLLKMNKDKIVDKLLDNEGFAMKTSVIFADEFDLQRDTIKELTRILNIVPEKEIYGYIVFTGFRSTEWENKFKELKYGIGDTVTSKTVAVITPVLQANMSQGSKSTKIKGAEKMGVPIIQLPIIEDFYNNLYHYTLKGVKKGLEKSSLILYVQDKIKDTVL